MAEPMASASAIAATSHVIRAALDPPIVCTRNAVACGRSRQNAAGSINAMNLKLDRGRASPPSAVR